MNFMLRSKRSDLISNVHSMTVIVVIVIGIVIDFSHAGVIPSSGMEPAVRSMVVDTFKTKILDHLGLEVPPVTGFTNKTLAREALREQIKEFVRKMKENEHQFERHTGEKHFHPSGKEKPLPLKFESTKRALRIPVSHDSNAVSDSSSLITFTANDIRHRTDSRNEKIKFKSAVLRIRVGQRRKRLRHKAPGFQGFINVTVSLVVGPAQNAPNKDRIFIPLKSFTAQSSKFKLIKINLASHLSLLSDLISFNKNSITIDISVRVPKHNSRRSKTIQFSKRRERNNSRTKLLPRSLTTFVKIVPNLKSTVVFKKGRRLRTKRETSADCERNGFCRRQSTYISFAEIGWDSWILSPEGYTAYYCAGSCPSMFKAASAFTGIKGMLHELNPSRIPEPSCAPTGYRPISLLYMGESQTLVEADYPDMIVTGCRCF